jgi:predicted GNAT family acetyltransferase
MNLNITHDANGQRFFAQFEDGDAELVYTEPAPKVMDIQHTFVPESGRGHGVADALADAAFDYARDHGLRVVPTCPFIRRWLSSHPERATVLDPRYARRER